MISDIRASGAENLRESIFVYTNATPGTGIASTSNSATFVATNALINIFNSATVAAGNNQWIIPVSIIMTATAVNTSATNFRLYGVLDGINRYSSGGTALTAVTSAVDTRSGYTARTAKGTVYVGALTLAAASAAKPVFNRVVSPVIFAVDDSIQIWFGSGSAYGSASTQSKFCEVVPMVSIGRGCNLSVHGVGASQAASPDFEFEITTIESGHPRFDS